LRQENMTNTIKNKIIAIYPNICTRCMGWGGALLDGALDLCECVMFGHDPMDITSSMTRDEDGEPVIGVLNPDIMPQILLDLDLCEDEDLEEIEDHIEDLEDRY